MKHSEEQINKMAADVLGKAFCSGSFDCDGVCYHCGKHESNNVHANFCTDLNAAQRLLKKADAESTIMEPMLDALVLIELGEFGHRSFPTSYDVATASAKTITLAALAAAEKISIEDAKESL